MGTDAHKLTLLNKVNSLTKLVNSTNVKKLYENKSLAHESEMCYLDYQGCNILIIETCCGMNATSGRLWNPCYFIVAAVIYDATDQNTNAYAQRCLLERGSSPQTYVMADRELVIDCWSTHIYIREITDVAIDGNIYKEGRGIYRIWGIK